MDNELSIKTSELVHWFNALRNVDSQHRTRALDAFWDGQISSKCWLVNKLLPHICGPVNVYIFGGWIGVLANMFLQHDKLEARTVRSIDLDPWCEKIADDLNKIHEMNAWRFKARTADMSKYEYEWELAPDVVINTSTEHISQSVYEEWYERIPAGTLIVAQGNNFFNCDEHIRCSNTLTEFEKQNHVTYALFSSSLETSMYTRYMSIWRK
jgi:hypothetical protein